MKTFEELCDMSYEDIMKYTDSTNREMADIMDMGADEFKTYVKACCDIELALEAKKIASENFIKALHQDAAILVVSSNMFFSEAEAENNRIRLNKKFKRQTELLDIVEDIIRKKREWDEKEYGVNNTQFREDGSWYGNKHNI